MFSFDLDLYKDTTPKLSPSRAMSSVFSSPSGLSPLEDHPLFAHMDRLPPAISSKGFFIPVPLWSPPIIGGKPGVRVHKKKQPAGHIPRARNNFIIFRGAVSQQKIFHAALSSNTVHLVFAAAYPDLSDDRRSYQSTSKTVDGKLIVHHEDISKFTAALWRTLSTEEREPWCTLAKREAEWHSRAYSSLRQGRSGQRKVSKVRGRRMERMAMDYQWDSSTSLFYRPRSCPPGKERVPQAELDTITPGFGAPITNTRDDLVVAKHPSRHTVYQSEALAELNCKCEPRFDQDGRKIFQTHRLTGINIYEDFRNLWPEETPWTGWDEDTSWEEEDDEWEPVEWGAWAETWGGEFETGLSALLFRDCFRPVPPDSPPIGADELFAFSKELAKLDESFGTLSQTNTPDWVGVVHEPSLVPRRDSFDTLMRDLTASLPDF
ncbi:hypothetical protein BKA70DRAFT_1198714 [Coprinopsis sp. MPI-PUGE-AT-0042]|nr:hypothetical protein BKA70DRAFT_1198714 [Coprinopsis sp. MPI-PUGE-AT-0042]